MKIIRRAATAAAIAVVAGAVAMGGTASAVPVSATQTMAHAAPTVHSAVHAATASGWGKAHPVPGLATLNAGHSAGVTQVSCASPGNCAATGTYTDAQDHDQAFVANEKKGTWARAVEVPGLAALSQGSGALASAVSCASAGNCAATGVYLDVHGHQHAFVADEKNGTWQNAHAIPGLGKLNPGGTSSGFSVSCASPGNCAVGGSYFTTASTEQAFVADEKNGTWVQAIEVPGTGALNGGGRAETLSISCPSAGNCAIGGFYEDATISFHAFVADETSGQWGQVHTIDVSVTGITPINEERVTGGVSCASAGNCAATGNAGNATGHAQVFVADEAGGTWGPPQQIPGTDSLNAGIIADAQSISCPSPGYCATGGQLNTQTAPVAYVADERAGGWDLAQQVFGGTIAFNTAVDADAESVSCGSLGNCAAGGSYITPDNVRLAFVVNEVNGSWGNAHNVPGIVRLATGGLSDTTSVSCASPGNCAAGGFYRNAHGDQAFVADQSTTAGARRAGPGMRRSPAEGAGRR